MHKRQQSKDRSAAPRMKKTSDDFGATMPRRHPATTTAGRQQPLHLEGSSPPLIFGLASSSPMHDGDETKDRRRHWVQRVRWTVRSARSAPGLTLAVVSLLLGVTFVLHVVWSLATPASSSSSTSILHDSADPSTPTIYASMNATLPSTVPLRPLRPVDYEFYTVRLNTWQRPEQLLVSAQHYLTCPGMAQMQIVWCLEQGPPPPELLFLIHQQGHRIMLEEHALNSLNERFRVLSTPPTLGIFHVDDDWLRPCVALDAAFFRWTQAPHRLVGLDARTMEHHEGQLKYGYLSTTERTNHYALTLTRAAVVHVDYMYAYWQDASMPAPIRQRVADVKNCEDVALSLWITAATQQQPPLLADFWAMQSMVKLYAASTISGTKSHKKIRDTCVQDFVGWLGLNASSLVFAEWRHGSDIFECGAPLEAVSSLPPVPRRLEWEAMVEAWKVDLDTMVTELGELRRDMSRQAYAQGLVENTGPWKRRFGAKLHGG